MFDGGKVWWVGSAGLDWGGFVWLKRHSCGEGGVANQRALGVAVLLSCLFCTGNKT